jgi:hypothetical protein
MRVSDQDYLRSCVAKERQLAHLLGHPKVEECYESAGVLWDNAQALPQWTRDWAACGPLIAQYAIAIHFEPLPGQTEIGQTRLGDTTVHFSDHPNRESALMFGVVKEVIRLLGHPKSL